MLRSRVFPPTLGLILLTGAALSMGQAAPPPTKLAVVNIVQLFQSLDERGDGEQDIQKMKDTMTDELKKRQKEIEDLQNELKGNIFKPDSDEYNKMQNDLMEKSLELRNRTDFLQNKLFIEQRVRTKNLYNKIQTAVATYSQANGIALVFSADDINISNAQSQDQLQAMIAMRKLIYYHPSFDITKALIEKMNTDYKLGGRK